MHLRHAPSQPVTQLPQAFAVSVQQDDLTRLTVFSTVSTFVLVTVNSDYATCGRSSRPIEHQPALCRTAGGALKRVMLEAAHLHGGLLDDRHQAHSRAAVDATHSFFPRSSFIILPCGGGTKWERG